MHSVLCMTHYTCHLLIFNCKRMSCLASRSDSHFLTKFIWYGLSKCNADRVLLVWIIITLWTFFLCSLSVAGASMWMEGPFFACTDRDGGPVTGRQTQVFYCVQFACAKCMLWVLRNLWFDLLLLLYYKFIQLIIYIQPDRRVRDPCTATEFFVCQNWENGCWVMHLLPVFFSSSQVHVLVFRGIS
jgi:hypothetical protein